MRIKQIYMVQTNDEVAAKDLEWEFTIDGEVYTDTEGLANGDLGYFHISGMQNFEVNTVANDLTNQVEDSGAVTHKIGHLECNAFKFRVRNADPAGTNQTLGVVILYDRFEAA
ncbi:unnamed protein product [marine sediment metagenome]|uniref:Uncharacterized protein n=1 Tax=marine sediment metagenome TaxID=412755 RepID=X1BD68_9ZZZZ